MSRSPGLSALTRRRFATPRSAALVIIALTAFAGTDDRRRALRAGYQAHLAKPVDSGDLLATVASFAELIKQSPRGKEEVEGRRQN